MLDSIWLSLSGLDGFSKGLKTISNNVSNMNTPGFRRSQLLFEEQFQAGLPFKNSRQDLQGQGSGMGVNAYATRIDFTPGEMRSTGQALDLAVVDTGYFVLKGSDGELRYTRAGQFEFDDNGVLRNKSDRAAVMGTERGGGALGEINLNGMLVSAAKATASVRFSGYLSSTATDHELGAVKVYDRSGAEHLLKIVFTNEGATEAGTWKVTVTDGLTSLGEGKLTFVDGKLDAANSKIQVMYTLPGLAPQAIELDFSDGVTSFASGSTSTLTVANQDGYSAGTATGVTFDNSGVLSVSYSNGQSAQGRRLVLARMDSDTALSPIGGSQFVLASGHKVTYGSPRTDGFGRIESGQVEGSNVELSREFSDLVVMQRGYQAASQTISTANDLIQSLFDMKGRR